MRVTYESLAVEVTRRCNMRCAHCLRGEAQSVDISSEVIDRFLDTVGGIGEVTFTGGEPTLNVAGIRYFLDSCKKRGIPMQSFFIATNGLAVTEDFIRVCFDLYLYCAESTNYDEDLLSSCCVALSTDMFHEDEGDVPKRTLALLKACSFFDTQAKDNYNAFTKGGIIDLGRAKNLKPEQYKKRRTYRSESAPDVDYIQDDTVFLKYGDALTLTAAGEIMPCCDYEYDEVSSLKLGSVFDQHPFWEKLVENYLKEQ